MFIIAGTQSVFASTSEYLTMSVGETRTLTLPPSITQLYLKDVMFVSEETTKVRVLYNTATTVTVEALAETSYYVPIKCDIYYYTLVAGKWIYAHHEPFYFMVLVMGSGPGPGPDPDPNPGWGTFGSKCTITTAEGVPMIFVVINEGMKYCAPWGDGLNNGTCIDKNTSGTITIPAEVGGYRVYNTGGSSFKGCEKITGLNLPSTVVSTGSYSFENCHGITSIDFLHNVERIYNGAFYNCLGLTDVIIPNSVKYLDSECFAACYNLKNVTIGANVQSIGNRAFAYIPWTVLETVTCLNETPPTVESSSFEYPGKTILYVPKGSLTRYQNHSIWKQFKEIKELKFPTF